MKSLQMTKDRQTILTAALLEYIEGLAKFRQKYQDHIKPSFTKMEEETRKLYSEICRMKV